MENASDKGEKFMCRGPGQHQGERGGRAVQWGAESRGDDAPGWGAQDRPHLGL